MESWDFKLSNGRRTIFVVLFVPELGVLKDLRRKMVEIS